MSFGNFPVTLGGREWSNNDFSGRKYYSSWPQLLASAAATESAVFRRTFTLAKIEGAPAFGPFYIKAPSELPIGVGSRLKFSDPSTPSSFFSIHVLYYYGETGELHGWVDYLNLSYRAASASQDWLVEINPSSGGGFFTGPINPGSGMYRASTQLQRLQAELGDPIYRLENPSQSFYGEIGGGWERSSISSGSVTAEAADLSSSGASFGGAKLSVAVTGVDVAKLRYNPGDGLYWASGGVSVAVMEMVFRLPQASAGGQRFRLQIGWSTYIESSYDIFASGGIGLEYSDNVNSGQWVVKYGATSPTSSNTTAVPGSTSTPHHLKILVGGGVIQITYDSVVIFTQLGSIGGTADRDHKLVPSVSLVKQTGSSPVLAYLDGFSQTATTEF